MKKFAKKTFLTKIATMVTSVALALCFVFTPSFVAEAAIVYTETISAGETWNKTWTSAVESETVNLNITETGLYDLTVVDNKKTGCVVIGLKNADDELVLFDMLSETDGETLEITPIYTKTTQKIILVAGQKYELVCTYISEDFKTQLDADVSVTLNKNTSKPETLPNCNISDSNVRIQVENGKYEWFQFTTEAAGDYSFNVSSDSVFGGIDVFSSSTGKVEDSKLLSRYDLDSEGVVNRQSMAVNLEGNQTYYICFTAIGEGKNCAVSMTRNDKTVENIAVNAPKCTLYSSWAASFGILPIDFNYKISYTDGTREIISEYYDIWEKGYELPEFEPFDDIVYVNSEMYYLAGKQPIATVYDDVKTVIFADVFSVTDWLADINADIVDAYDTCIIENKGVTDDSGWWRIKVSETGVYSLRSYDYWEDINCYLENTVFVDQYNNIVEYNDAQEGWPLVAGNEYALNMQYTFKNSYDTDFEFWLGTETNTMFPDTSADGWYNDAVTYAVGSGIMTGYKSNGLFGTSDSIQRQDFIVMLARYDGVDLTEYVNAENKFPDVDINGYYAAAVKWGSENGIITGYTHNGCFGVGDSITREQLVTMLYRYAKYKGRDINVTGNAEQTAISKFGDYSNVSVFSKDAILWATEKGVITGKGVNKDAIDPQGRAQRCEVAQNMYNIFKNDIL